MKRWLSALLLILLLSLQGYSQSSYSFSEEEVEKIEVTIKSQQLLINQQKKTIEELNAQVKKYSKSLQRKETVNSILIGTTFGLLATSVTLMLLD